MQQQAPRNLPLKLLLPWAENPRASFDAARHAELVASLRAVGLLQPLLVRPKGDQFEVIAGNRRLRALTEVHADVPWDVDVACLIREVDDADAIVIALAENTDREELRPLEEAAAYGRLRALGTGVEELALRVAKSPNYVRNRLRLLELHPRARSLTEEDRLTLQAAFMLAQLDQAQQEKVLDHLGELKDASDTEGADDGEDAEGAEDSLRRRPIPLDHVRYAISRVARTLRTARFPILNTIAGVAPCTECPKRTGAQATLFKTFACNDDECLDEACFDAKTHAHSDALIARAKAEDRLLDKKETKSLFRGDSLRPGLGFLQAQLRPFLPSQEDPPTYSELAAKAGRSNDVVVAVDALGIAIELVSEKTAYELRTGAGGFAEARSGQAGGLVGLTASQTDKEWKRLQKEREQREAQEEQARLDALLKHISEADVATATRVIAHALAEASFLNSCRQSLGLEDLSERIHLPLEQRDADLHAAIASAEMSTLQRLIMKSIFDRTYALGTRKSLLELGSKLLTEVSREPPPPPRAAQRPRSLKKKPPKKAAPAKRKRAA